MVESNICTTGCFFFFNDLKCSDFNHNSTNTNNIHILVMPRKCTCRFLMGPYVEESEYLYLSGFIFFNFSVSEF